MHSLDGWDQLSSRIWPTEKGLESVKKIAGKDAVKAAKQKLAERLLEVLSLAVGQMVIGC